MELKSLGYVGIGSNNIDDWSLYATRLLGMQSVDKAAGMRVFRMDDRKQRLVVEKTNSSDLQFIGWEVESEATLTHLADRLDAANIRVVEGSRALADERCVGQLVTFGDPEGNRLEAYCHPQLATEPFTPGRPITGFRTGSLGMGHIVLNVVDIDRLLPFYRDLLGFRISDFGLAPYKLYFFHLNGRHHSFALVEGATRKIHHLMIEVTHIDDLGQGYDIAQLEEGRVAYTLGRHTNDHVTSFYTHSPSGFFVEYGWGGRTIDPASWTPHETVDGPSLWGHERLYMQEAMRTRLREMRMNAAVKGIRAPLAPDCPWLDTIIARE